MAAQEKLKKQFGFVEGVKNCASCKHLMSPNNDGDIYCNKTGIMIENTIYGVGYETQVSVCNEWSK